MKDSGAIPNSFSYNTVAKPFAARGEYHKVEQLMRDLRMNGLPLDDFCMSSLLNAYGNAKPKQKEHAAAAFCEFARAQPAAVSPNSLAALSRVVGRSSADDLCQKCGLAV